MILYSFLPGISHGQCPSSYNGKMIDDGVYGSICGFRQIYAAINLNGGSSFDVFGRMDISFSNNVKILAVEAQQTYIENIIFGTDYASFDISEHCEEISLGDDVYLVKIKYTLLSGTSATAETENTRLAYCNGLQLNICPNYSEASPVSINVGTVELNGKILAPGEFSCTGGNSTDNGLPERFVNVNMANSPFWNLCEDIETDGYGYYECSELREDCDYTVFVSGPGDDFCGIDEFDQDIIRDLVLGNICPFDYKWQHFAADANNDGVVSTADIVCLERYLHDETPYNMPYTWKYVSNTQYDAFTPICDPAEDRIFVPAVNNCSNINMDDDPIIEDWYGFPVGDLNHTCNSCGFRGNPHILNRNNDNSIDVSILKRSEQIISLEFNHNAPINVWSLVLTLDIRVEDIKSVNLVNSKDLYWSTDNQKNLLKLSFVGLQNQEFIRFNLKIDLKNGTLTNPANWSINTTDTRLNNIAIDKNKDVFLFFLSPQKIVDNYTIFPNPTKNVLNLFGTLNELKDILIFQLDGKLILKTFTRINQINIESLKPGSYILQLKTANGIQNNRFIKYN
ncbi:MAG: T9SS type A sorting domain-containing protein [Saprospiraceae bacterium]